MKSPPTKRTAVCTVISPNYRHFARVLMESVRTHHPEWDRYVLVVGGNANAGEDEPFEPLGVESMSIPGFHDLAFRYTILELDTAVKPWLIGHLFALGYERVLYLDPDVVVYSPFAELDVDDAPFLTLTPHLTAPVDDAGHRRERSILIAGAWNLGFLAISRAPQAGAFLDWWKRRLERGCVVEPENGLFVDQKWIDLAPGLFEGVVALRHDGYNVAYWNLQQRRVTRAADGALQVNGRPLRFFHFSGFDPSRPQSVSRHDPSQQVAAATGAAPLFEAYAAALHAAGMKSFQYAPYAYAHFTDGSIISAAARIAYRRSPQLQAAAGGDPFRHPELFRGLTDQTQSPASPAAIRTYWILSGMRPLVQLLPRRWRRTMREGLLGPDPPFLLPLQPTPLAAEVAPGVAIAGYFSRETGVGESARLCVASCDAAGVPNERIDVDRIAATDRRTARRATILHVNADMTPAVAAELRDTLRASYAIGVWHWELPDFPAAWIPSAAFLREIWAPSAFVADAVAKSVTIPVVHMPHGVEVTELASFAPAALGVSERRFVFLLMFDFDSYVERKNPAAAVEAFRRAFSHDDGAALLIKTTGASRHRAAFAELQARVAGVPHVHLVDRTLERAEWNGLIAACDAVVSLHRAEGFGLVLAEAMALGKPVVATGWSGNVDFMTAANSCPVDYELVAIDRDYGPYTRGSRWAEPDVDHAAEFMTRLVRDSDYRARIGRRASETMRTEFSPIAAGRRYRQRLLRLGLLDQ